MNEDKLIAQSVRAASFKILISSLPFKTTANFGSPFHTEYYERPLNKMKEVAAGMAFLLPTAPAQQGPQSSGGSPQMPSASADRARVPRIPSAAATHFDGFLLPILPSDQFGWIGVRVFA